MRRRWPARSRWRTSDPATTTRRAPSRQRRGRREQGVRRVAEHRPRQRRRRGHHAGHQLSRPVRPDRRPPARQLRAGERLPQRHDGKDALPTFFARLFGMLSQGVRRPRTAEILAGNSSDCIKPWAVADRVGRIRRRRRRSGPTAWRRIPDSMMDPDWNTDFDLRCGRWPIVYVPPSNGQHRAPGSGSSMRTVNSVAIMAGCSRSKQGTGRSRWLVPGDRLPRRATAVGRLSRRDRGAVTPRTDRREGQT